MRHSHSMKPHKAMENAEIRWNRTRCHNGNSSRKEGEEEEKKREGEKKEPRKDKKRRMKRGRRGRRRKRKRDAEFQNCVFHLRLAVADRGHVEIPFGVRMVHEPQLVTTLGVIQQLKISGKSRREKKK